jgi:hypothetical protein
MRRDVLALARDPNTPQSRLLEMVKGPFPLARAVLQNIGAGVPVLSAALSHWAAHPLVGGLVVQHPNASPEILSELGWRYPREFWRNPSLPLLFLEGIGWLARLSEYYRGRILSVPEASVEWFGLLLETHSYGASIGIAKNPRLPPEFVARLLRETPSSYSEVFSSLAQRPDLAPETYQKLREMKNWYVSQSLAANPQTPAALLVGLQGGDCTLKLCLNPSIPPALLDSLLLGLSVRAFQTRTSRFTRRHHEHDFYSDYQVLQSFWNLAQNPSTPPEHLPRLLSAHRMMLEHLTPGTYSRDLNWQFYPLVGLKRLLARRADLPDALLLELARDEEESVRREIARRDPAQAEARALLLRDPSVKVRRCMARGRSLSVSEAGRLARDVSPEVRVEMARRPGPVSLACLLACDVDVRVRRAALHHPALPRTFAALLRRAGMSPDLSSFAPPEDALSREEKEQLFAAGPLGRALAAPHESERWRGILLVSTEPAPKSPAALAQDAFRADLLVRRAAIVHPNTPREVLVRVSSVRDWTLRAALAENPALPLELLETLSKDPRYEVRRAVARHPALPWSLLEDLSCDVHLRVRHEARRQLRRRIRAERPAVEPTS